MSNIILFQGAILSKGRTFTSAQNSSENIEYSTLKDLLNFSTKLNEININYYFLFWENEIEIFKNENFFKALDQSKIIPIPKIENPRGKLKNNQHYNHNQNNKLLHYYAMHYGISILVSKGIAKDEDIIIRSRTDITFDHIELDNIISNNIQGIVEGKMLCQYWRKENPRWFIDFIFASNTNIMYNLYAKLYLNCLNNRDYAFSIHQDIIKTLATLYLPSYFIYREGAPKTLNKKVLFKLIVENKQNLQFKFPLSILEKIFYEIIKIIVKISYNINRLSFLIYTKYEFLILFFVYEYFIYTMSFKLQKSIVWRRGKNTNNYLKFKKENFNQTLIFSDINN